MRQLACGYGVDAEMLGGLHAAVAGDNLVHIVDQDRIAEAELLDAPRDLPNLLPRMRSGIVWIRTQLAHRPVFDLHGKHPSPWTFAGPPFSTWLKALGDCPWRYDAADRSPTTNLEVFRWTFVERAG